MKATTKKPHPKLIALQKKIGGKINAEDGELYYGPPGKEIFIHTIDGTKFILWSQQPLYTVKDGRARLARERTTRDSVGWYSATVAPADVEAAIKLALAESDPEFASESLLHHNCAQCLSDIEPGLTLYRKGRRTGIEFDVGGRRIDILAVDSTGSLVVIELKRPEAHDRVIGQLLRYMGWIRQNVAKPNQRVRGVIIARQFTRDLRLAASTHQDIQLKQYEVRITYKDA